MKTIRDWLLIVIFFCMTPILWAALEDKDQIKPDIELTETLKRHIDSRIEMIQALMKKAGQLGAVQIVPRLFNEADQLYLKGIEKYKHTAIRESLSELEQAESLFLLVIDECEKVRQKKREKNLAFLYEETLKEMGLVHSYLSKQKKAKSNLLMATGQPGDQVNYLDLLNKAGDFLYKAKQASDDLLYDHAGHYLQMAKKLILTYQNYGVKTFYQVKNRTGSKRETLWKISNYDFIYGNAYYWPLIWKANQASIQNPDLIYPGQVLIIPSLEGTKDLLKSKS